MECGFKKERALLVRRALKLPVVLRHLDTLVP
jgi:hypothetical protein